MRIWILFDFDIARQRNDNLKFPPFGVRCVPFCVKFWIFPKWLQITSHGLKIIWNQFLKLQEASWINPDRFGDFPKFSKFFSFLSFFIGFWKKLAGYRSNQKMGISFSDQATNFMKEKFLRCSIWFHFTPWSHFQSAKKIMSGIRPDFQLF